jgi:ribosomal protein S9
MPSRKQKKDRGRGRYKKGKELFRNSQWVLDYYFNQSFSRARLMQGRHTRRSGLSMYDFACIVHGGGLVGGGDLERCSAWAARVFFDHV